MSAPSADMLGLDGVTWIVPMPKEKLVAAAAHLLGCHDHNFAVLGGGARVIAGGTGIACSELAKDCLAEAGLAYHVRAEKTT